MRRRSWSVKVFRGVDDVLECVDVAETGVAEAGVIGTGAEGKMEGWSGSMPLHRTMQVYRSRYLYVCGHGLCPGEF